jgi:hypothetical protein
MQLLVIYQVALIGYSVYSLRFDPRCPHLKFTVVGMEQVSLKSIFGFPLLIIILPSLSYYQFLRCAVAQTKQYIITSLVCKLEALSLAWYLEYYNIGKSFITSG